MSVFAIFVGSNFIYFRSFSPPVSRFLRFFGPLENTVCSHFFTPIFLRRLTDNVVWLRGFFSRETTMLVKNSESPMVTFFSQNVASRFRKKNIVTGFSTLSFRFSTLSFKMCEKNGGKKVTMDGSQVPSFLLEMRSFTG